MASSDMESGSMGFRVKNETSGEQSEHRVEFYPGSNNMDDMAKLLCNCVEDIHFAFEGQRVQMIGVSAEFLRAHPLKDMMLNIDGYMVEVTRVDPSKCMIEFELPKALQTDDKRDVKINVGGRDIPMKGVNFQYQNVIGVTQLDQQEEEERSGWSKRMKHRQNRLLEMVRGDYQPRWVLLEQCVAEFFGTAFIVIFGVGVVCTATLTGAQQGVFQVAVVWGFGVGYAIYSTASISGAHLNPAVSLAFAMFRPHAFPWRRLLPFWAAQLLGGMFGGAVNLGIFRHYYDDLDPDRNQVLYASTFGEYFPNPGVSPGEENWGLVSAVEAMLIEAWGTGILMFMILALTDERNRALKNKDAAPFLIGFTVATLISVYGPLQQAGWNPARDFGPRLIAAMAGWGYVAIPGPRQGFWAYIVGPLLGAPLGALVYDGILARGLRDKVANTEKS